MKLSGKVIKLESGGNFKDKTPRAHIQTENTAGDPLYKGMLDTIWIPNLDGLGIDDEVTINITPVIKELSRAAS